MKLPLTTVATLVAVFIAHEGSLVAAGPTSTDTATTPNDASASAFVEQERGVASDAFPVYCPKILTSSFLKKGRATLDYSRLWKKKLDPKDGTVEKVADWLSVRFAYARMGHNYTDPTIVSEPPSFTIWVPPVAGLVPIANPVANYQATGIDQLAFIDGVAKHYKKKPVYININHRLLGQPAGQAVVSVLDTCFGGAISGIPRSNGGALGNSDYPMTNQYALPPQDGYEYNNAAPYVAQPQNSGYPTTSQYGPPPQGGSGHNNAAPYGAQQQDGYGYNNAAPYDAQLQNNGYPTTSQYGPPPQGGSGHNNAAPYGAQQQDGYGYNNAAPYDAQLQNNGYPMANQYRSQGHSELPKVKTEQQQYEESRNQWWEQQRRNQQLQQQRRNEKQRNEQQAADSVDDLLSFSTPIQVNQQPIAPDLNAYQK